MVEYAIFSHFGGTSTPPERAFARLRRVNDSLRINAGTELMIVQEGLPDVIPAEACYLGWQESLAQLANLVDPEIPD